MDEDELAAIAAQLCGRIREDSAEDNARWLAEVLPDPADWFRLNFAMGAAVPVDVPWLTLTEWTARRGRRAHPAVRELGLKPHGTRAAAARHARHGERCCELCLAAERDRKRVERSVHKVGTSPVDNPADPVDNVHSLEREAA